MHWKKIKRHRSIDSKIQKSQDSSNEYSAAARVLPKFFHYVLGFPLRSDVTTAGHVTPPGPVCARLRNTGNASEYTGGCAIGWSVLEELCLLYPLRHKTAIHLTCPGFSKEDSVSLLNGLGLLAWLVWLICECWSTQAQVTLVHARADPRHTGHGLGIYTLTVYRRRGMLSVLSYGRIVARAVLGGLSQTDGRDYSLITASCGFGKDFRKGILKKGMCYGDDACFIARHKSADVLGE